MDFVSAILDRGHGVASGRSQYDRRFPQGTIRMQAPFFRALGLDIEAYFDGNLVWGTLNLNLAPRRVQLGKPEIFLPNVLWTEHLSVENFFLSPARIDFAGREYKALLYIPDPATKTDHFQNPSIVEAIAEPIEGLQYGDRLTLGYNPEAIFLADAAAL